MKDNCNIIQDLLQLYVEGVLSPDSRELVEEHLSGCEKCRAKLEEIRSINAELDGVYDGLIAGKSRGGGEAGSLQKFKRWLNMRRIITVIITAAAAAAVFFTGHYFIFDREAYVPYEESGIIVTDNGKMYTDRCYSCLRGFEYEIDTAGNERHLVEFMYLSSSFYSRNIEKKPENKCMIDGYGEANGYCTDDDGKRYNDVVTEVYYLSEKYVDESSLLNSRHDMALPENISKAEEQAIVRHMKENSVPLWKKD